MTIREAIDRLVSQGEPLTSAETEEVALEIMDGKATPAQIASLLTALRMRGERAEHLAGFARAMRRHMVAFPRPVNLPVIVDTCGTGGDKSGTYNISTAAAFIVAAAGVPVAKHGNRSMTSLCGSADVLEALGIHLTPDPEKAAECLAATNFCFLFAPQYHPAMRHAGPVRKEIGIRTIFNLCGPLANPARPNCQLIGAASANTAELLSGAALELGIDAFATVHSYEGLDELTPGSRAGVYVKRPGETDVLATEWDPEAAGVPIAKMDALKGGDAVENARILEEEVLAGRPGPKTNAAALNAGAALWMAGKARSLKEGYAMAHEVLALGKPLATMREVRRRIPRQ